MKFGGWIYLLILVGSFTPGSPIAIAAGIVMGYVLIEELKKDEKHE